MEMSENKQRKNRNKNLKYKEMFEKKREYFRYVEIKKLY